MAFLYLQDFSIFYYNSTGWAAGLLNIRFLEVRVHAPRLPVATSAASVASMALWTAGVGVGGGGG